QGAGLVIGDGIRQGEAADEQHEDAERDVRDPPCRVGLERGLQIVEILVHCLWANATPIFRRRLILPSDRREPAAGAEYRPQVRKIGTVPVLLLMLLAPALGAAQTASQRLERLAAESYERALDLFPVNEIFSRGAGPRQDKFELVYTDEHRER